jgi:hypothetical protein
MRMPFGPPLPVTVFDVRMLTTAGETFSARSANELWCGISASAAPPGDSLQNGFASGAAAAGLSKRRRDLARFDEKLRLPAGEYELYLATFPGGSGGCFWMTVKVTGLQTISLPVHGDGSFGPAVWPGIGPGLIVNVAE